MGRQARVGELLSPVTFSPYYDVIVDAEWNSCAPVVYDIIIGLDQAFVAGEVLKKIHTHQIQIAGTQCEV